MARNIGALAIIGSLLIITIAASMTKMEEKPVVSNEEAKKNLEMIEYYANKTELTPYESYIIKTGIKRMKRAVAPVEGEKLEIVGGRNDHWCCKEDPVVGKNYSTRSVGELVMVTRSRRRFTRCGFGGWERCSVDVTYLSQEMKYKSVLDTLEIPQAEWVHGCPEEKLFCCRGFILNADVKNCMTQAEVDSLITMLSRHGGEALCLMRMFGVLDRECPLQK
ncbi:unnamed protein product [Owenia fusiformis]|uniref:Uncharacterized protein n=1 Tax=Owenia fusiformis TaxID=6347 RepID=A0A8J1UFU5_OWEFU|nr:unnamed protein product [Owenia fusiformis]